MDRLIRDVVMGTAGAWVASKVMERVGSFIYERQSDASRQREEQLRPDPMPPVTLVRKGAELLDMKIDDQQASGIGTWIHYGFGLAGGPAAALLRRRWDAGPFPTGLAVGLGMSVTVDEGLSSMAAPLAACARASPSSIVSWTSMLSFAIASLNICGVWNSTRWSPRRMIQR